MLFLLKCVLKGVLWWVLLASAAYFTYWGTGTTRVHDEEVTRYAREFSALCDAVSQGDVRCTKSVDFYWKKSWRPPLWLWRKGWVTPYEAVAPFYVFTWLPQGIMIDPKYWHERSVNARRELIWHEMGHAVLGWDHSDNQESLMRTYGYTDNPIRGFVVAWKENEE